MSNVNQASGWEKVSGKPGQAIDKSDVLGSKIKENMCIGVILCAKHEKSNEIFF